MTPGAKVVHISPQASPGRQGTKHRDPEVPAYLRLHVLSKSHDAEGAAVLSCMSQPHPGPQKSRAWESSSLISSLGTALLAGSGLPRISCLSPRGF